MTAAAPPLAEAEIAGVLAGGDAPAALNRWRKRLGAADLDRPRGMSDLLGMILNAGLP